MSLLQNTEGVVVNRKLSKYANIDTNIKVAEIGVKEWSMKVLTNGWYHFTQSRKKPKLKSNCNLAKIVQKVSNETLYQNLCIHFFPWHYSSTWTSPFTFFSFLDFFFFTSLFSFEAFFFLFTGSASSSFWCCSSFTWISFLGGSVVIIGVSVRSLQRKLVISTNTNC